MDDIVVKKRRRLILDLAADAKRNEAIRSHVEMDASDIFPLDSPGLSTPGPDFIAFANRLGDSSELQKVQVVVDGKKRTQTVLDGIGDRLSDLHRRALREPGFTMPVQLRPGLKKNVSFVPGHIWGQHAAEYAQGDRICVDGPRPADVMLIAKMPGRTETQEGRCMVGESGQLLVEILRQYHVEGTPKWYVTNLLKFQPPDGSSNIRAPWLKDCLPLLQQELRLVRPKYILCVGADASKALLGPKCSVDHMDGRVMEYKFPVHLEPTDDPAQEVYHTALVMTVLHPAAVVRAPEQRRRLERGIIRFDMLQRGIRFDKEELDTDHRVIRTLSQLQDLLYEIDHDPEKHDKWIGFDAEWHGEHPQNKGSYVRTMQLAWRPKHAAAIVWADTEGKCAFVDDEGKPARKRALVLLNKFFADKRICGHFLVADLEWMEHIGLTMLAKRFEVPLYDKLFDDFSSGKQKKLAKHGYGLGDMVPAWARTHVEGGWDTGLAAHAVEETAQLGLEVLAVRYTTAPRYDIPLNEWKDAFCKSRGMKVKDLEGYGHCPDEVLAPYGCLHQDSLVQLADGSWRKISELVSERYGGGVKAFADGRVIDARVVAWHRNAVGQSVWFQLLTPSTPSGRWGSLGPVFTPDHKILTVRGMVPVEQLSPGVDMIVTDEREFSPDQLSVLLGSLLGDGGWTRQNNKGTGFGFGQRLNKADYADWKADVFSTHNPSSVMTDKSRRYTLPFSRYLYHLSQRFPGKRKAVITRELLDELGDLGLAVWYQDNGTLVIPHGGTQWVSRIYCKISQGEAQLVVDWLMSKFGDGVSYNRGSRFIQITRESFYRFQKAIRPFVHPSMAYKTRTVMGGLWLQQPKVVDKDGRAFCETIVDVTEWKPRGIRRGYGVRYCLTVEGAHNFLTSVGFVSNCYDADSTLRLAYEQMPLLDCDYEGNSCRESFWESMLTPPVILEMHRTGLPCDRKRIDFLTEKFMVAKEAQELKIRTWSKWPEFNIRSVMQVREFLFGEKYNGKKTNDGAVTKLRPQGAKSLGLDPILDTSKPPKQWRYIREHGLENEHSPGTGKAILGVLAQENPNDSEYVRWVLDYRFLDQVLKTVLRPPKLDKKGEIIREDDSADAGDFDAASGQDASPYQQADNLGNIIYDAGLASVICDDGRIRTHMYPTTETKRWRSARPNLFNLSKRRDPDYIRLLGGVKNDKGKWVGGDYKYKLRSLFYPLPGHVLIEADYIGAELYMAAILSGDATMIDHTTRNQLPESHHDFHDIHSNIAVRAFALNCSPTKAGLESIGKIALRIAAKNIIFGMLYGRGAKAIAFQCKEEGNPISVDDAQRIIDFVFDLYPGLVSFFAEARSRAVNQRWLCGCFGAFRRFPVTDDFTLRGEFERQAMNYPMQNGVASVMDRALAFLRDYRDNELKDPDFFKFALQVYDAGLFHVPYANVERFVEEVLPWNMSKRVNIYPTDFSGDPTGEGPYHLGIDTEVYNHWGEQITLAECEKFGVPKKYGK